MKVILRSDLDGLGKRGDIVEVADGDARNFLFPKGHALTASDGAVAQAGQMRQARDQRDSSAREAATTIASTLVPKVITVSAKAGPEGKLFGSIRLWSPHFLSLGFSGLGICRTLAVVGFFGFSMGFGHAGFLCK